MPMGRMDEAVREAQRARELDPLSLTINGDCRDERCSARDAPRRRSRKCGTWWRWTRRSTLTNEFLATAYLALGRYAEAVPVLRRAIDPALRLVDAARRPRLRAREERAARARRSDILRELLERQRRGYIAPTSLAVLSAGLGDTAETYAWLRRAVEAHDPFLLYNFVNDPVMAPFRRDPRGQAILRAMGLRDRDR